MSRVGSFGGVVFSVSKKRVKTFNDLSETQTAKYAEAERYLNSPSVQFVGMKSAALSMTITLSAAMGVEPLKQYQILSRYMKKGYAYSFFIGKQKIGVYKWVITSMKTDYKQIDYSGNINEMKITLSLTSYEKS